MKYGEMAFDSNRTIPNIPNRATDKEMMNEVLI
jgi:hypothetical protein